MAEQTVTSIIDYVELEGEAIHLTGFLTYSEMSAMGLYASSMLVLVELEPMAGEGYAVAVGHDIPEGFLVPLNPQPRSVGMKITRRGYNLGASAMDAVDDEPYLELEWSGLGTAAQYRAILEYFGLDTANYAKVTVWFRDAAFNWIRRNGTAIRPRIRREVQWQDYFPRNIVIRVIGLESAT